MTSWYSIVT